MSLTLFPPLKGPDDLIHCADLMKPHRNPGAGGRRGSWAGDHTLEGGSPREGAAASHLLHLVVPELDPVLSW